MKNEQIWWISYVAVILVCLISYFVFLKQKLTYIYCTLIGKEGKLFISKDLSGKLYSYAAINKTVENKLNEMIVNKKFVVCLFVIKKIGRNPVILDFV
jgi:hypothetical protein